MFPRFGALRIVQIRAPNIPAPIFGEYGAASRSLLACHELVVKGGFTNVVHVVRTRASLR